MSGEQKGRGVLVGLIDATIELLELLLALALALLVLFSSIHVLSEIVRMEIEGVPSKGVVLEVLDLVLLLVLAVDILRTLVVAIRRHALPVRIVIEAAMVAILREIIAVEVRHLDWKMILALGTAFVLLAGSWTLIGVLQRRGELEATAVGEEG